MGRTIAFTTLGCKLNFAETAFLERQFVASGYTIVKAQEVADVYVLNSCSVTEHSDKKSRNILRRFHKQNKDAFIAVIGCYAQLKPDEISEIEGVSLILGTDRKGDLLKHIDGLIGHKGKAVFKCDISCVESVFPAFSSSERTRAFLKVQDGCNYKCSYCTIPTARGKSRNISIKTLIEETENIAASGVKEIVLTGVNTGDFGRTTGETFLDLLKALNDVEGIERYRISSIEPNLLTQEMIEWISQGSKVVPHFHIPLQAGSDEILRRMRRRYTTSLFRNKIAMIRKYIDNVFFGIDVIVGFPGETDEVFEQTYKFLEEVRPAFLHVFPYSKRNNTDAALMPDQVDYRQKAERVKRLSDLSDILHTEFYNSQKGSVRPVLFENRDKDGKMFGYTDNYLRIEQPYDKSLIGEIVNVEVC